MHEHMKGWVKNGHQVTLFASKFKNSKRQEEIDGIKIVRAGYQYVGVQLLAPFYYFKNFKKYDLVVDQFHGLPFFTPFFVRKHKLAVIQEMARKVWFLNPLPWPINLLVGLIGFLGEPFIFLFYKNIPFMTGSESAKISLTGVGIKRENITVVPHGVIIEKPKPMPKKADTKTVIYLGILSKDKGIEDAARCFTDLSKKGSFDFWVIGKAETLAYGRFIQWVVHDLGITKQVKFWGFVSQKEKFELLAKAHIMINPSVHEGWGLVNIEANVMGTPVVAYHSEGLTDSVKDGVSGVICPKNTPEELAAQVLKILNDEDLYKRLQNGAVKWGESFNWEQSVVKSLALLKKVINEG